MTVKTNFIVTCDSAFLSAGSNNLNLIGIFGIISGAKFPLTHPRFALVANFDIDQLGSHALKTQIIDQNGKETAKAEISVDITTNNFQFISNFENLSFPAPGRYEIKVMLDGTPLGSRTIEVRPLVPQKTNYA